MQPTLWASYPWMIHPHLTQTVHDHTCNTSKYLTVRLHWLSQYVDWPLVFHLLISETVLCRTTKSITNFAEDCNILVVNVHVIETSLHCKDLLCSTCTHIHSVNSQIPNYSTVTGQEHTSRIKKKTVTWDSLKSYINQPTLSRRMDIGQPGSLIPRRCADRSRPKAWMTPYSMGRMLSRLLAVTKINTSLGHG